MFAGWDWASETHDVTVIDDDGTLVDRWELTHSEDGIAGTLQRLARHARPEELPVAIETTRGLVIDRLRAAGHPVVPVHPNAFHAARPRWGAARAKTDARDSALLAEYLRTDAGVLRELAGVLPETMRLQALTRARADQIEARVAAVNQLAATLAEHWPGGAVVFADLESDIALAFLERYPTQAATKGLSVGRMEQFCRKHGYSGRRSGEVLIARLRSAARSASVLDETTITTLITAQIAVIRAIKAAIRTLDQQITTTLAAHPWAPLIAGMPRIGTINLAQIIGEVGPILERAGDCESFIAETGVAPVTRASGKRSAVTFRYATNKRARLAITTFADNSRHADPRAAKLYTDARARGKRHPHATRILARSWLRIIWACYRDGTLYDPNKNRATEPPRHAPAA